jgi:hypothetical protein
VSDPHSCPSGLSCLGTNVPPISGSTDGVCLPINASCSSDKDCTSAVFNRCQLTSFDPVASPSRLSGFGSYCGQGDCLSEGAACQPGSSCLKRVLPATIKSAMDSCTPDCSPRQMPSGATVNECLPGFTCLADAFPQTHSRVCTPGFPGWLCVETLGCLTGTCEGWGDVSSSMAPFQTCSPKCSSDDDCVVYDRNGNPNVITKFTCHAGTCRNWQSLFFPELCLHAADACTLDPEAKCAEPSAAPAPDGGVPRCTVSLSAGGVMPLGALGGSAASCVRGCAVDGDCAILSNNTHVPHACVEVAGSRQCLPSLPAVTPCTTDATCLGDLSCLPVPGFDQLGCTHKCSTTDYCKSDPALGAAFGCQEGLCVPLTESGCAPSVANGNSCLSGRFDAARQVCVSPSNWACDQGSQCSSGSCVGGRCK